MIKGLNSVVVRSLRYLCIGVWTLSAVSVVASELTGANQLKNIDFRLNKNKEAVLIVELASPSTVVDVQKKAQGLTIELLNTEVADDQLYLFDVKDFASAVETIEVFRQEPSTLLEVSIQGAFKYDYSLRSQYLEVVITELKKEEPAPLPNLMEKQGKLISINFQDIPVRNVLQLIADYNQFNLVVSD